MNSRVRRIINYHTHPIIEVFTYNDILKLGKLRYRKNKKYKDTQKRWLKSHLEFVQFVQGYVDKHIPSIYYKELSSTRNFKFNNKEHKAWKTFFLKKK